MDRSLDISLQRPQRRSLLQGLGRLAAAIGASMERVRTRRLLAQLSALELSDSGISHSERMAELDQPFWR
ncbi:Uncharacterized conserved protein YjiS, DUF1127 family [Pseudomonas sp. ok272]|uniref:DUF1127 domain-containing protein n=1 Tax=unclassified Pseudomonas TaxID=196821 RepID=UPI0008C11ED8|nr:MULTISPECIES: DUF1127 domain-containing protein [unclassified Pseudomonas]SEM65046.1 Uncharacterized conserved protein YjiS, DUF1127 family [Pseudomonas sp. ok272]SFM44472.1 Uncharacterized conserved protein YjiS, DUF1127 family [Pseudomonas sp. ok602]